MDGLYPHTPIKLIAVTIATLDSNDSRAFEKLLALLSFSFVYMYGTPLCLGWVGIGKVTKRVWDGKMCLD